VLSFPAFFFPFSLNRACAVQASIYTAPAVGAVIAGNPVNDICGDGALDVPFARRAMNR
jgi:hypothetical protein